MTTRPPSDPEPPHDILAAEEFAIGAADPGLHHEPPHDVLAAEEFALPAADRHAVPPGYTGAPDRSGGRPGLALAAVIFGFGVFVGRRLRRS